MIQEISNNEVSRKILDCLDGHYPQAVKFVDLVSTLDIDEKVIFKNLFFLEENSLVQLMSSYPTGATFPTIHMVKIRDEGKSLVADEEKLDAMFPLRGFSSRLDLYRINNITLFEIISALSSMVSSGKIDVKKEERGKLLKELKNLSEHPDLSKTTLGKIFENF